MIKSVVLSSALIVGLSISQQAMASNMADGLNVIVTSPPNATYGDGTFITNNSNAKAKAS